MTDTYYQICASAEVTRVERELIKNCAKLFRATARPTFVNIGVMWGCTVHCLRAGHATARIVALDIKYSWKIKYKELINVEWVKGDSTTYHKQFRRPIDLLLIDGDHHYSTVSKDIAGWTPKVRVGGIVIFHDYKPTSHNLHQFPELADVKQAVSEWVQSERDQGRKWKTIDEADSAVAFRRLL